MKRQWGNRGTGCPGEANWEKKEHHQEDLKGQSEMLGLVWGMKRHLRFVDLREREMSAA